MKKSILFRVLFYASGLLILAMELLSVQMAERKKRRPQPLKEPVHKIIPPILIRRETTA